MLLICPQMVKVTALVAEEKGGKAPFGSTRPSIGGGGGGGSRTVVLDALEGEEISYSEICFIGKS